MLMRHLLLTGCVTMAQMEVVTRLRAFVSPALHMKLSSIAAAELMSVERRSGRCKIRDHVI